VALLELRNVETYYGPIAALRGVSLDVDEGRIVTVLGANGAGKTTLLKTISGALDPETGTIRYVGVDIQRRASWEVAATGIAHVPEGREVFRHLSVADNLRMGGFLRRDIEALTADLERIYDYFPVLRARVGEMAGNLSGGEQQMLAIGRALMARPRLILLDEPSLGLSPRLVQEIYTIINRVRQDSRVAMLLVEQNAKMALDVADSGYVLEGGRIVLEGSAERLRSNDDVKEFYLGIREAGVRGERRWKRRKHWR
jgi:branched-chain amino acid transport system ATP-binding protein